MLTSAALSVMVRFAFLRFESDMSISSLSKSSWLGDDTSCAGTFSPVGNSGPEVNASRREVRLDDRSGMAGRAIAGAAYKDLETVLEANSVDRSIILERKYRERL